MNKDELLKLAERVEALGGPDREVDAEIYRARFPGERLDWCKPEDGYPGSYWNDRGWLSDCPRYTYSIDSAMALVPEEHAKCWSAGWAIDGTAFATIGFDRPRHAATPASALTAAALRALDHRNKS